MNKKTELSPKQKSFCEEYLKDFNGTQALIRAGYSAKSARAQAAALLTKPNIKEYLSFLTKKATKRNEIDVDRVLQEIRRIALLDPAKMFTESGSLKNINDMDEDARRAIASVKLLQTGEEGDTLEVRLWNKLDALEKFMKHFGAYATDNKQKTDHVIIVGQAKFDTD